MSFRDVPLTVSCHAAKKRLEERFNPRKLGSLDEMLATLRKLIGDHEKSDDRFMMWLLESCAEFALIRYVETEAEIAHFAALGYTEHEKESRAKLVRLESEWRICATASAYFQTAHIENSSKSLAAFLRERHGEALSSKPKKAGG